MTVGWLTLDVGEQALIYNHHGSARIEDGPKRLFLWREKVIHLTKYSANQNEYLAVSHRDGRIEHWKGPCVRFDVPIAYKSITVKSMIPLDANEAVVVYNQDTKSKSVSRTVQFGPSLFMPQANEWLHQFDWHWTDPKNKTRVIPSGKVFTKLQIIPDQFYYNVNEVRTADDALIRIKLMLFYELKDIETMLNGTKDPVADFINCLCADVVAFASKYTYIEFMEKSGGLNDLGNYPQLLERCKQIGYEISKVVYRGYLAHDRLQQLHDNAIETRTTLKIAYEREEQEQMLTDLKMKNEKDRTELEQKLAMEELIHTQKLKKGVVMHDLAMKKQTEDEKRKHFEKEKKSELQAKTTQDGQTVAYFNSLHALGVDLNQYLLSQSTRPNRITRVVAGKNTANLHLHHSPA
ncbi:hypothetical protein ScPMuIL_017845 [Solemya velum]